MLSTIKWAGLRKFALALGLCGLSASGASAATISAAKAAEPGGTTVPASLVFNTSGTVGTTGITGTNVISFVPVSNSTVLTSTSLSLGTFVVAPLPTGQTTTYNHTPFAVSYATKSINGTDVSSSQPLLTLTGFFNGTVSGADQSNVVATFDTISDPTFKLLTDDTGTYTGFLSLPSPQRTLVPSTTFGGQSTAEGFAIVKFQAVPEPTAIALLIAAGAGLGLRRRFRAAR